jgi:hypothetical protein
MSRFQDLPVVPSEEPIQFHMQFFVASVAMSASMFLIGYYAAHPHFWNFCGVLFLACTYVEYDRVSYFKKKIKNYPNELRSFLDHFDLNGTSADQMLHLINCCRTANGFVPRYFSERYIEMLIKIYEEKKEEQDSKSGIVHVEIPE